MITLTAMEIYDLARFAGFMVIEPPDNDEKDVEFAIDDCPPEGVVTGDEQRERSCHIVYSVDYPEEGCIPLGETEPVT